MHEFTLVLNGGWSMTYRVREWVTIMTVAVLALIFADNGYA